MSESNEYPPQEPDKRQLNPDLIESAGHHVLPEDIETVRAKFREVAQPYKGVLEGVVDFELDFSEESIKKMSQLLTRLRDQILSAEQLDRIKVAAAIYIAEALTHSGPELIAGPAYRDEQLADIYVLKQRRGTAHVLSWVEKAYENPEGDELSFKFRTTLKRFEPVPDFPPEN